MRWTRILVMAGVLMLASAQTSQAESYDPYLGMYNTGGYNLLGFGNDLFNTSQYLGNQYSGLGSYYGSSYGSSWGGGCGTFYGSCSSGWDLSGLYGSDWGLGSYGYGGLGLSIDISILTSLYGGYDLYGLGGYGYGYGGGSCGYGYSYGYSGGYGSSCGGYYPNYYDVGCSIGYCGGGSYLPYYGGTSGYGNWMAGYNPFNITININTYLPYYEPPRYPLPSYGNCGGIITCPSGPITRYEPPRYTPPTYTPPTYYPPPTVNRQEQVLPTDPIRYRIPRGATTH